MFSWNKLFENIDFNITYQDQYETHTQEVITNNICRTSLIFNQKNIVVSWINSSYCKQLSYKENITLPTAIPIQRVNSSSIQAFSASRVTSISLAPVSSPWRITMAMVLPASVRL